MWIASLKNIFQNNAFFFCYIVYTFSSLVKLYAFDEFQDISEFQALSKMQAANWEKPRLYAYHVHTTL